MIFKVFEKVLAELASSGEDEFGDQWLDELGAAFENLSTYYGNQNLRNAERELIDYSGLPTQAAYIFMYAIGRAEFAYQLLKRFRAAVNQPLFKGPAINVTSVGGGPASELVGLVKYIEDKANGENVTEILYDVIDKESDWTNLIELVVNSLDTDIKVVTNFMNPTLQIQRALDN